MASDTQTRFYARLQAIIPLAFPLLLVLITCVRWLPVSHGFDWGWDYETAYRVFRGERYGIDFFTTVGPLSYELLGHLFKLTGPAFLTLHVVWYACWIATLLGAYLVLRLVDTDRATASAGLSLAVILSAPHATCLHTYNFLALALSVYTLVALAKFWKTENTRWLFVGGILAGLNVFTKQNLGLGCLSVLVLAVALDYIKHRNGVCGARALAWLGAGVALAALPLAAYFSRALGARELARLMFEDAALAKGGFTLLLKSLVPRVSLPFTALSIGQRILTHAVELLFALLFIAVARRRAAAPLGEAPCRIRPRDLAWLTVIFAALTSLNFFFPDTTKALVRYVQTHKWMPLVSLAHHALFVFVVTFLIHAIFSAVRREKYRHDPHAVSLMPLAIAAAALLLIHIGHNHGYIHSGAAFFVPLAFAATARDFSWNRVTYSAALLSAFLYMNFAALPESGFGRLKRMPFAELRGIRVREDTARQQTELYTGLRGLLANRRTLWLAHGGPHSLALGKAVLNVSTFYRDQYSPRIDPRLKESWLSNPPEYLLMERNFVYHQPRTTWLGSRNLYDWIHGDYELVGKVQELEIRRRRVRTAAN